MRRLFLAALLGFAACKSPEPTPTTATATATPTTSTTTTATATASASASASASAAAPSPPDTPDTIATNAGPLTITPIHHATLLLEFKGRRIYLDPTKDGVYDNLPKADYVFITDIHGDHLDPAGIDKVKQPSTKLVGPPAVNDQQKMDVVLKNGDKKDFGDFSVEAIPMYNLVRGPQEGKRFHDKGRGDGYVLTFGGKRVYVSGDTECTPEMRALKDIDVAFVCMNLPYTMPPSEAAECVKAFKPKVVYPYHFRGQSLDEFKKPLEGQQIDVRVRRWY